ncbi:MAG: three-helix bundle dimerization domain-containing protein [Pseudolysinimonas sp.]
MGSEPDPEQVVTEVTRRLSEKNPETSPIVIEQIVRAEVDELSDRPVQDYLAVLSEREAKKKLRERP